MAALGGQWNGEQILSADRIEQSLSSHIGEDDRLFFYGYHW